MNEKVIRIITYTIVGVWGLSVALSMFDRTYQIHSSVQLAMAAVYGYLATSKFVANQQRKAENDDQNRSDKPRDV